MRTAFTLIELLVAIGIIAILIGAGLVAFGPARGSARDARRISDLEVIRQALETYKDDRGLYPVSGWVDSGSGQSWIAGLVPDYIDSLPVDPVNTGSGDSGWVYRYWSGILGDCGPSGSKPVGSEYVLMVRLESGRTQTTDYCGVNYPNTPGHSYYAVGE